MRFALPLLLLAAPAMAADEPPHTGRAGSRTMPEASDLMLAASAAGALWFVRRRLRARFDAARSMRDGAAAED
jgi:hypothetical protein